jgi:hypothetical protein
MAWSDAARAAALEARRAHSKSKQRFPQHALRSLTKYNAGPGEPAFRAELARKIRAIRKGKKTGESILTSRGWIVEGRSTSQVMDSARQSTAARNFHRDRHWGSSTLAERVRRMKRRI